MNVFKSILLALLVATFLGCRAKRTKIEKENFHSSVERVSEADVQVQTTAVKDSIIKVAEKKVQKETSTGLTVEFDPKKHDSLEITHVLGGDSLHLKITGNGVVKFDYKQNTKSEESSAHTIFGSKTLFKMDSTLSGKTIDEVNKKAVASSRQVNQQGTTFPIYLILAIALVVLIILAFVWNKFGGKVAERLKQYRNKR